MCEKNVIYGKLKLYIFSRDKNLFVVLLYCTWNRECALHMYVCNFRTRPRHCTNKVLQEPKIDTLCSTSSVYLINSLFLLKIFSKFSNVLLTNVRTFHNYLRTSSIATTSMCWKTLMLIKAYCEKSTVLRFHLYLVSAKWRNDCWNYMYRLCVDVFG